MVIFGVAAVLRFMIALACQRPSPHAKSFKLPLSPDGPVGPRPHVIIGVFRLHGRSPRGWLCRSRPGSRGLDQDIIVERSLVAKGDILPYHDRT